MAIGRISGQLLKANLLREGTDLAFETDLLYLDVNNSRIGVKTASPVYDFDVNGTINATSLRSGSLSVDDVIINNSTITTSTGNINIEPATPLDNINLNGNVEINGNLHATGAITADGSITLGDANTDNVVFAADINSDIIPNQDKVFNMGNTQYYWNIGYFDSIETNNINVTGSAVFAISIDDLTDGVNNSTNLGLGENIFSDPSFDGIGNVAVGNDSQSSVTTGIDNTTLGNGAGSTITTGNNNIVIGAGAEPSSPTVSNEITLGNAQTTDVRIPGVTFYIDDGDVLIGTDQNLVNRKLQVAGSANVTGTMTAEVLEGLMDGGFY